MWSLFTHRERRTGSNDACSALLCQWKIEIFSNYNGIIKIFSWHIYGTWTSHFFLHFTSNSVCANQMLARRRIRIKRTTTTPTLGMFHLCGANILLFLCTFWNFQAPIKFLRTFHISPWKMGRHSTCLLQFKAFGLWHLVLKYHKKRERAVVYSIAMNTLNEYSLHIWFPSNVHCLSVCCYSKCLSNLLYLIIEKVNANSTSTFINCCKLKKFIRWLLWACQLQNVCRNCMKIYSMFKCSSPSFRLFRNLKLNL